MKQIFTSIVLLISSLSFAQNGLENIIVEKYYKSSALDTVANADGGVLPVGSVTYRIYADLLPGYTFQAAYGIDVIPAGISAGDHELRISTSTKFFNHEVRGNTSPTYTKNHAKTNTVMLDSWLSGGAACAGNFGILKSEDDSIMTVVNIDNILMNADTSCGIPLNQQDGLIAGSPQSVTFLGIDSEIAILGSENVGPNGQLISTYNGSWAVLGGAVGPDNLSNKVIIAQLTTDGIFSFELNIQIGTPNGDIQKYVAKNPMPDEILLESLTYTAIPDSTSSAFTKYSNSSANSIMLYPNPVKDFFYVQLLENKKLSNAVATLYSSDGRTVKTINYQNLNSAELYKIDSSELTDGIYFLEIKADNFISQSKIIK